MSELKDMATLALAEIVDGDLKLRVWNSGDGNEKLVALADIRARINASDYYDVSQFTAGAPGSSAVVFAFVATRALTFPAAFTASKLKAKTAATAQTVFDVQKNGVSVGSITVAISGTTGTFAAAAATNLAAGDLLEVIAPVVADDTLASLRITLVGALA